MKRIIHIITGILLIHLFWACAEDETETRNEDLLFTQAFQIKIPEYQYEALGVTYTVRGDTGDFNSIVDTLNSEPKFKWDSIGVTIITAAIFNQPIVVQGGEIINIENLIWQWHSGMEFGKEGEVQYSDGRNVLHLNNEESIDYQNPATPLNNGHYYWAVWGWNQSGISIWYSSRQLEFYVSE